MKLGAVRAIYIHQIMADDESVPITISTGPNSTDVPIRALPNTGSQLEAISNSIFQSQFEGVTLSPSRAEKNSHRKYHKSPRDCKEGIPYREDNDVECEGVILALTCVGQEGVQQRERYMWKGSL